MVKSNHHTEGEKSPVSSDTHKRLLVFMDGTWNEPTSNTNVWRTYSLVEPMGPDGIPQISYYEPGVGSSSYPVLGGMFGFHMDEYIKHAYAWLVQNYHDRDELFVFGFSRGAYMVRTLVGLISQCGLLRPGSPITLDHLYERYRSMNAGDGVAPPSLQEILSDPDKYTIKDSFDEYYLSRWARDPDHVRIRYVGIFDTVESVGIPFGKIQNISRSTLGWNKIGLNRQIEAGRHALAIDEHRFIFRPTLWTLKKSDHDQHGHFASRVEQRWFVGSHSNVGGGYRYDSLQQIALRWIVDGAENAGMKWKKFEAKPPAASPDNDEVLASPVMDSLASFLGGVWKYIPIWGNPYYRPIGQAASPNTINIHETIDESVFRRWRLDPTYRPVNLMAWARKHKLDLDTAEICTRYAADGSTVAGSKVVPDPFDDACSEADVTGSDIHLNNPWMEKGASKQAADNTCD